MATRLAVARRACIAVLLLVWGLTVAGCLQAPVHPAIALEVSRHNDAIQVEGTTDLPDGALVEVVAWPGCSTDPVVATDPQLVQATVHAGTFVASLDWSTSDPGTVTGTFVPGDEGTIDIYGDHGQKMSGDGVYEDVGLHVYRVKSCG